MDLGEDDWFEEYEKNMNPKLLEEISTVSLHVNAAIYHKYKLINSQRETKNPVVLERIRLEIIKQDRIIALWNPRLADMRRNATLYIRASSFCNKEILGPKFFKTQLEALDMDEFFGADAINKRIILYHYRAGNKTREELEQIKTDARALKRELESFGFDVELMNEGQATIYHWQQFKLLLLIFGGRSNALPEVLIDENECPNLCSSIMLSPLKKTEGRIELDKTSEKKAPLHKQVGLTTQLPSALIYLLFGRYGYKVQSELSSMPDNLPDNISI